MRRSLCILVVAFMSLNAHAADKKPPTTGPIGFSKFEERIPGTLVKFEMLPIPPGKFLFSPDGKSTPQELEIKRFWMAKYECRWLDYDAYHLQLDLPEKNRKFVKGAAADAIARPSPPYSAPDHSWGRDDGH